jgi:hypothetical protein
MDVQEDGLHLPIKPDGLVALTAKLPLSESMKAAQETASLRCCFVGSSSA